VVHVTGEIDMVTAPELQDGLEYACDLAHPPDIVVADLTGVRFMGSAAMSVLLEVDQRCRDQLTPLNVVVSTPVTTRPLRVTGLDHVLRLVGSLDSVTRSA
jgi:anti-sigma B factor antagonist